MLLLTSTAFVLVFLLFLLCVRIRLRVRLRVRLSPAILKCVVFVTTSHGLLSLVYVNVILHVPL